MMVLLVVWMEVVVVGWTGAGGWGGMLWPRPPMLYPYPGKPNISSPCPYGLKRHEYVYHVVIRNVIIMN